jgi:AraC-like DNA-binding protein
VFRAFASFDVAEVAARHRSVEARAPGLRVAWLRGENVSTDYGLLNRTAPFSGALKRAAITVVLEGDGRFEERSARTYLRPGEMVVSDQRARGTEAFVGSVSSYFSLEWDPTTLGAPVGPSFALGRLPALDVARLRELAPQLAGPEPARVTLQIMALLRAAGLPLATVDEGYLADRTSEADRRLSAIVAKHLGNLEQHPAIEDVTAEIGWTARHVNRRLAALAQQYAFPWEHWRASLHHARMLAALRLASVGAPTEMIARKTGFRSPTALCHAFAKAGLPSPGVLARAAKRDVLDRWSDWVPLVTDPLAAE